MTHEELADKRRELEGEAAMLLALVAKAREAGDRRATESLLYAVTHLMQLAESPLLHVYLDEVLEDPVSLSRLERAG